MTTHKIHVEAGQYLVYEAPDPETLTIESIARGLAKECRYNGHCYGFYSVAIHSVMCSFHVPRDHALQALLHDAPEAFTKDIPYDLKRLLGQAYKDVETRVWHAIADKFGVPREMHPCVKRADDEALMTEKRDLKPDCLDVWNRGDGITPWRQSVKHLADMPWQEHERLFLARYRQLLRAR